MRYLIVLSVLLSVSLSFSFTNDPKDLCGEFTKVLDDPFTTRYKVLNKEDIKMVDTDGKMLFKLTIVRHEDEFTFSFQSARKRCFEQENLIHFVLEGGKEVKMRTTNPTSCKGHFTLNFGGIYNSRQQLMDLANHEIKELRFKDVKWDYRLILKPEQSRYIKGTLDCMLGM